MEIGKEKLKEISCAFFRWWYNAPGNNTEQGFDEWWKENKEQYDPSLTKPKPPPGRIIIEGTMGTCPKCHSTEVLKYWFFGKKIGCIQPKCERYHKLMR